MTDKYKFLPKTNQELISLSNKKLIYTVKDDLNLFVKIIKLVSLETYKSIANEIELQIISNKNNLSPKILDYYIRDDVMYIIMEKVNGKTIYDLYGDSINDVPIDIIEKIHKILSKLLFLGIEYKDITSYNFILTNNNELKVIDFGHAKKIELNWFLKDFLNKKYDWNPDFL